MNNKILATVSAIAVLAAVPAMAENASANANVKASAETSTTNDLKTDAKNAWQGLKKNTSEAYESVKEGTSEAYENIKATFIDDEAGKPGASITIDSRHTANGMIGKPVYNSKKERVGTLRDIIVDANGNATLAVIGDGEIPGYAGKLVAFDYGTVSRKDEKGDVIAPISEENINQAAEFSYDTTNTSNSKVRVIPNNGYSVADLLDADVVDAKGEDIADVDNISFRGGKANQLIVGFDKVLGLGGQKAVIDYSDATIVREDKDGDDLNFKLSANHAAQFEAFKKSATN